MAMGVDGSIVIDTKLDSKGFNDGMQNVGKKFKDVTKTIATSFAAVLSTRAIVGFVKSAIDSFSLMSSNLGLELRSIQWAFLGLQGAVVNALAPAFAVLYPYILEAINYFTRLFTILAQISLAFFGVSASAKAAALATQQMSKAVGAGALASFDKLNVLNAKPTLPGVNLDPAILKQVDDFKAKMLELLQPAIDAFDRLKKSLEPLGQTIWEGLKWGWDNILVPFGSWVLNKAVPTFMDLIGASGKALNEVLLALKPLGIWLWENFLKPAAAWTGKALLDWWKFLTDRLKDFSDWISKHQGTVQNFAIIVGSFAAAWGLVNLAIGIWDAVGAIATAVTTAFGAAVAFLTSPIGIIILAIGALIAIILLLIYHWDWVKQAASDAWTWIQTAWINAGTWFTQNVSDPIKNAFQSVLDWLPGAWNTAFSGVTGFVKGAVNTIIDFVNSMIRAISDGLNSVIGSINSLRVDIPAWVPVFGGQTWGVNIPTMVAPQIPRLATGAVIPPNAAFPAILGDQTSGTNIEAPENLIRKIMQEEIGNIRAEITLNFEGSLAALVREMRPYVHRENIRVGPNLIKGVMPT